MEQTAKTPHSPTEKTLEQVAMRVSIVSIISNLILTIFKLLAGFFARSSAMVSDGIHSASDVFSTLIVIIGVKLSAKESDKEHPYGHERLECVAALILSAILMITGLGIGASAIRTITAGNYQSLEAPGLLALIAAVISIIVKETMFWYTEINAKRIESSALMADAWHHRSDALSSVGALIGIAGARMGYPILDTIASIVICIFIAKAAIEIFIDAVNRMIDQSCDEETEQQMRNYALEQEGVLGIDLLRTRVFGNKIYVDMEISADGSKTLIEAHETAEQVHNRIEEAFPKVKHIMIHVNPAQTETTDNE